MSTITRPGGDLKAKLDAIEADLSDLRQRRAVAARERDDAKRAFTSINGYDPNTRQFKAYGWVRGPYAAASATPQTQIAQGTASRGTDQDVAKKLAGKRCASSRTPVSTALNAMPPMVARRRTCDQTTRGRIDSRLRA